MEILKKADVIVQREGSFGRDPTEPGMYETWMLNPDVLDSLIDMADDDAALVSTEELGSKGFTANGCAYGINKVCVAGCLPLKARAKGKKNVVIINTGEFDENNYSTDKSIVDRKSNTAYEQPSPYQIKRIQTWLTNNGYVDVAKNDESDDESSDEPSNDAE